MNKLTPELKSYLEAEGYFDLKEIPNLGICGLNRFMFTVGLVIGINEIGYHGRYCYANLADAKNALNNWDGTGDPPEEWIKYKGRGGERSRIKDEYND